MPNIISQQPILSELQIKLQNIVIFYNIHFKKCFLSQETMASRLNLSSRHVRRLLVQLKAMGLLVTKRRGFNMTLSYELPKALFEAAFVEKNWYLFPLLRFGSKWRPGAAQNQNVRLYNIRNNSVDKIGGFILQNLGLFTLVNQQRWVGFLDSYGFWRLHGGERPPAPRILKT